MSELQSILTYFLSDRFWFFLIQIEILGVVLWAIYKDLNKSNFAALQRGELSRSYIANSAKIIFSAFLAVAFELSDYPAHYKLGFFLH